VSTPRKIDLDTLSYKNRSDAAGLLISKGNQLVDAAVVAEAGTKKNRTYVPGSERGELVDVGLVLAAVAYFDMALLLMRPFDPNYKTVINWKCNALCAIGQYADAVGWYEEIVRIDGEEHGGTISEGPTTALAQKRIVELREKDNAPLAFRVEAVDDFVTPPFTLYAQHCLTSLAKGKYAEATSYFAEEDRKAYSAKVLKQRWQALVGSRGLADLSLALESHLFEWEGKSKHDIGWCYFSVTGPDIQEGLSFVVGATESQSFAVRRIEFGRP